MNFCPSCGAASTDGTAFCASCGASRGSASAAAIPTAAAGIGSNAAGALAYLAGLITGIIFLILEPYKNDRFVRFHAFQSIFFNLAWVAFWIVWGIVGMVLGAVTKGLFLLLQLPIDLVLLVCGFGIWVYLMYSAYQNKTVKLPIIGAMAARQAGL